MSNPRNPRREQRGDAEQDHDDRFESFGCQDCFSVFDRIIRSGTALFGGSVDG